MRCLVKIAAYSIIFTLLLFVSPLYAADFFADLGVGSFYTSNVYLNQQEESDFAIAPKLELGLDFANYWTAGYNGYLTAYTSHSDLLAHMHQVYLYANPAWGENGENEFFGQISLQTQRNAKEYSSINYLQPALDLSIIMESVSWFRWSLSQSLSYRLFYKNKTSDSVDSWTRAATTFTTPTKTTISPRLAYGFRYYPNQDKQITTDTVDQQIEAGLHLSQGLWDYGGLQADYSYLYIVDNSGMLPAKLSSSEFSYIGEEFLYSAHRAYMEFKQILDKGWRFGAGFSYELRFYGGWPAIDENGALTGDDRKDHRLSPYGFVEYVWWPSEDDSSAIPEIKVALDYSYLRQWSNDDWYDTKQHLLGVDFSLAW